MARWIEPVQMKPSSSMVMASSRYDLSGTGTVLSWIAGSTAGTGPTSTPRPRTAAIFGKFVVMLTVLWTGGGLAMYERFTDRSRKVMQLANAEAWRFHHEYVGTEHILLALIGEGS